MVHYAGVGCEMDVISEIAASRGIPVVEDNAHGLLGSTGKYLGTLGVLPLRVSMRQRTSHAEKGEHS
jgi:dTDP-4-amino-4,6-dideoxygalactose transaminase